MKWFSIPIALIILLISGCSEDESSPSDGTSSAEMTAIVDGESWSTDNAMALVASSAPKPFISFQGYYGEGGTAQSQIVMIIDEHTIATPETIEYPYIGGDSVEYYASYQIPSLGDEGAYVSIGGRLIIETYQGIGGTTRGTFQFTATNIYGDTVSVTDGQFDMPIVESPTD